jgi:ankyrin repeat protein
MTALYLACSHGNYEVMKLLVAEFADVNAKAGDGTPMLLVPAQKGFSMVTQYLLENGANPNLANSDGFTPLMAASKKGQRDVVKVLLANGADVTAVSLKTSHTALQEAIDNDHKEVVTLLMAAMKEAKEKNEQLFVCKSAEDVRSLVRDNAKVDERRGDQATPLIVQVERGNEEVVKELLKHGANVDLQDNEGESALMKACARGHYSIVQVIIAHRAILDLKSKAGETAMMCAVTEGHVAVVKELLMAGADPTIRNRSGQTAMEIAEELGSKTMVEDIKKHTAIADSRDPFINLLSGYLGKAAQKDPARAEEREKATLSSSGHAEVPHLAEGGQDEDSPLKKQLDKAWKRIADLETRVHDLTLQTTMEITDDTDLSFYDKKRLESEFRKLKELKHKAEQYAVEAKQTAQRLSAENFKLKEDLSREQHLNELDRKNILRDMEEKMRQTAGEDERDEAKKEVMQQTINEKALELASTMRESNLETRVLVNYEMIKDLILNQTVKANMALMVVAGLPYSGKSTVLRKMLNTSAQGTSQEMRGLAELEAVALHHGIRNISNWRVFEQQPLLLIAISLLRVALQKHPFPKFPTTPAKSPKPFGDSALDQCFLDVFNRFPNTVSLLNDENVRWALTTGDVSFVTAWDVGMLCMIAPECEKAILLDFFSLNCDADSIDDTPNLGDPCYHNRYKGRNDAENLLRLRSKLEYLYYPMLILSNQPSFLVATHEGLPREEVKKKSEHVLGKIEMQFHSPEYSHMSPPHLAPVGYGKREDIKVLQRNLEEVISGKPQFHVQLPVKWGFLRTYLASTKRMYIPLPELKEIAKKLHITNGDVMKFLKLFMSSGSLVHVTGLCPECADEFVIIRLAEFLREVEKIYYVQDNSIISGELKERAKRGYITKELANELWSMSDSPGRSGFFIHALRRMGVLTALKPNRRNGSEKTPREQEYFMPRIRPKACKDPPDHGSLFLTHGIVFPFPLQSNFLTHFHEVLGEYVDFTPMDCLNTLCFTTRDDENKLTLRFMSGYIEVHGTGFEKKLCSVIKTACIEVMAAIQRQLPKLRLKYSLATLCPSVTPGSGRPHFARFHPLDNAHTVFCEQCVCEVGLSEGALEWVQAPYNGPQSLVKYEEDEVPKSQALEVAESLSTLSSEELRDLAAGFGVNQAELAERLKHTPKRQLLLEIFLEFLDRTRAHPRRRLGQVLMNSGHWKEALKVYPQGLKTCLYSNQPATEARPPTTSEEPRVPPPSTPMAGFSRSQEDPPTLPELRLAAMHLLGWEEVGRRLRVGQETLNHCKESHRTTCEMAYQMLLEWQEGRTRGNEQEKSRKTLIRVLQELGCESTADFLRFGESDHYWK